MKILSVIKNFIVTWFLPRKPAASGDENGEKREKDFRQLGREVFRAKHDFDKSIAEKNTETEYQEVIPFQIKAPEGDETRVSR